MTGKAKKKKKKSQTKLQRQMKTMRGILVSEMKNSNPTYKKKTLKPKPILV
jgi:hypothetical protein